MYDNNGNNNLFFFLEHAGELRIFVLRREKWPITITNHTPWARVGDGRKTQKRDYYIKKR